GIASQHPHRFRVRRPRSARCCRAASGTQRARRGGADECRRELYARAYAVRSARPLRAAGCWRGRAGRGAGGGGRADPADGPEHGEVGYLIRARNRPELTRLIERVRKIADGAVLMTETAVKAQVVSAVSNLLGNTPLEKAMHDNLLRLGPPPFDEADRDFAR